jgi:hypothetical protein
MSSPTGATMPTPVTTTLLPDMLHLSIDCRRASRRSPVVGYSADAPGCQTAGRSSSVATNAEHATAIAWSRPAQATGSAHPIGSDLVLVDVVDGLLDRRDVLGVLVRNLGLEFFFECHHQFDGVQGVGAEVVDERRFGETSSSLTPKLFDDDLP